MEWHPKIVSLSQTRDIHRGYRYEGDREVCKLVPAPRIYVNVTVKRGTTESEFEEIRKVLTEKKVQGVILFVEESAE